MPPLPPSPPIPCRDRSPRSSVQHTQCGSAGRVTRRSSGDAGQLSPDATTDSAGCGWWPLVCGSRAVLKGEKKQKCSKTAVLWRDPCSSYVQPWLVAVGGWWQWVAGGWRLVDWRLAVGGWWRLAAVGGCRLVVGGGWWLAVRGSWQRLAVGGGWRLANPAGGP